ncbi:MAG TPA: DegT/DnrJ/EryC1/StrS family aminotransferase [Bryobacteraceae bacterium]|nr:DegT/DnrJ/EryC1/StrS family aminotransferase [Bryobacteraceae bacterium]
MKRLAILGGEPLRTKPFSPWPQFQQTDIDRVVRQIESRRWGGFPLPGPVSGPFAEQFAAMHGARYGLCVANGTVAITAALQAAGIGFRDEVVVPAYTWDGTATAVLAAGAVPIFADVDPDTYCLSPDSVRSVLTSRTRAVLPVHLAMRFTEMDALSAIAAERGLVIIEDCAHAHGGAYRGLGAGSMGAIGCFSFQESKLMTGGEGGICITSREDYYEALHTIVNCGRPSPTDKYGQRRLGSNYRMTELQACLLQGQLEQLPELRERRTRNAHLLTELLWNIEGVRPLPVQPGITAGTHYTFVFQYRPAHRPAPSRDLFVAAVEAEGVPCDGRFYEPVYRSDLFYATTENCPQLDGSYEGIECPVTERAAYEEAVWLPQTVLLGGQEDVVDVARAIQAVSETHEQLAAADPALAGVKALGRAQRFRTERTRNY